MISFFKRTLYTVILQNILYGICIHSLIYSENIYYPITSGNTGMNKTENSPVFREPRF